MRFGLAPAFLLLCVVGWADDQAPLLQPRPVIFPKNSVLLSDTLTQVQEQTGNRVADRRLAKNNPRLQFDRTKATFWQAIEAIAKAADARISLYQPDGVIALVDGPYRPAPVSYQGVFRVAVKRLELARDLETGHHSCVASLEAAWEPWFQPFYLEAGPSTFAFPKDDQGRELKVNVPGRGQMAVAGKSALEVEFRVPAPKRSVPGIDQLKGVFKVIGPSKMLKFTFDLEPAKKPSRKVQEGVAVSLSRIATSASRWSFDIIIENPPGGPKFESYQSWLDNNQIYLEKKGNERQVVSPNSTDEEPLGNVTAAWAGIRYHFTNPPSGKFEDWRLVYRTPGKIVEVAVPFDFKDLPLP
jgi:hypothetical protein